MTTELRSIYSGPIRRALEPIEGFLRRVAALETKTTATPWTQLALGNGWTQYGSGWTLGQYRKIGDIVMLRGSLIAPNPVTAGSHIATLPVGFRPTGNLAWTVGGVQLAGDTVPPELQVYSDGRLLSLHIANGSHYHMGTLSWSTTP